VSCAGRGPPRRGSSTRREMYGGVSGIRVGVAGRGCALAHGRSLDRTARRSRICRDSNRHRTSRCTGAGTQVCFGFIQCHRAGPMNLALDRKLSPEPDILLPEMSRGR
jgi:hypothetical protein